LITAHNQPEHLSRLINALDREGARFYVHIDKKTDVTPFQRFLAKRNNVHFLQKRVSVNWMGFSLVEVSLRLLETAIEQGFDYCLLLSGLDYPIKSNETLFNFFEKTEQEFIGFWRLEDRPSWKPKVQYYYPIDLVPIRAWSSNSDAAYWRRLFWGRFFQYRKYLPQRTFIKNMVPYGGPDWWSLSYACASYILSFVEDNSNYKKFFKYTHSPGELFFQTIILNSSFAERVANYASYQRWSATERVPQTQTDSEMLPEENFNYRYIDWSHASTGLRETPAVLDERDWSKIRNSHCHFARKFDTQRSAVLLNLIDDEILRLPN